MTSFRLKEEKRCLHAHWSLQPTHFLKDWMPIFIVDPVSIAAVNLAVGTKRAKYSPVQLFTQTHCLYDQWLNGT